MNILQITESLSNRLLEKYGNPLDNYKRSQDDIHMTYYVSSLMEVLGHDWVDSKQIRGKCEDRVYYSERALQDAFLAGQLLARADNKKIRANLISEMREQLHHAIENIEL